MPTDRPIDGIDQAEFLLGKQAGSNREFVVAYVGDRVFSVKWRTLKVHFYTAEGYAHLWVMKPVMKILTDVAVSQQQFPNIKPGEEFAGYE